MGLNDFNEIFAICSKIEKEKGYSIFINYSGGINVMSIFISLTNDDYNHDFYKSCNIDSKQRIDEVKCNLNDILDDNSDFFKKIMGHFSKSLYEEYIKMGVPEGKAIKNIIDKYNISDKIVRECINYKLV